MMSDPNESSQSSESSSITPAGEGAFIEHDPVFKRQLYRLHELTVYGRWTFVGLLWLVVAPLSLWGLRSEIVLLQDYFTWAAVRYGLASHRLSAIGLALCVGSTVAVLIWQSCNILMGLSEQRIKYLENRLLKIRQQGPSHPLWKWVCRD